MKTLTSTTRTASCSFAGSITFTQLESLINKLSMASCQPNPKGNFYTLMEGSGWLTMINKFLTKAKEIALVMEQEEMNVLVH